MIPTLDWLLAPLSVADFLETHYARGPLHLPARDPARFAPLCSVAEVLGLLDRPGLTHSRCRMVQGGDRLPRARLAAAWVPAARREEPQSEVDIDKVHAAYAGGATLILDALHERLPALAALVRGIEARLHHPAQINAYLTPGGERGFDRHYDSHDVFVLQIAGRKRWELSDHPVPFPLRTGEDPPALQAKRGLAQRLVLGPGDLLYLPRGHLHAASNADDAPSLHLTVGLLTRPWLRALEVARELAEADEAWRQGLPPGFMDDPAAFEAGWRARLERLAALDPAALHARLSERFVQARRPLARLTAASPPAGALLDAPVRRRPLLVCALLPRDAETLELRFQDRRLHLPAFVEPALRALLAGPPVCPRDLPGSLDAEGRRVLVRRLLREGVLEPAEG